MVFCWFATIKCAFNTVENITKQVILLRSSSISVHVSELFVSSALR